MGLRLGRGFLNMMASVGSDMLVSFSRKLLRAAPVFVCKVLNLVRCPTTNDDRAF